MIFMRPWCDRIDDGSALLSLADIFPGGGGPLADVFAIAIAVGIFALLFWAIDLIDRI